MGFHIFIYCKVCGEELSEESETKYDEEKSEMGIRINPCRRCLNNAYQEALEDNKAEMRMRIKH